MNVRTATIPAAIADVTLSGEASVADALASLTASGKGVALLIDADGRLVDLFTDGDLRRFLLAGYAMQTPLRECRAGGDAPPRSPHTISFGTSRTEALAEMDRLRIDHLPVLAADGKVAGCYLRRDIGQRIWLSTPHIGEEELQYVNEAFATNWVAPLGPNVDGFERELAHKVEVGHAAALSSGTAAIHLALVMLGVKSGDRVICSSYTFAASSNPILYQGAEPVFVDAEDASWNMCPIALERALDACRKDGKPAKAVIVVDLYGQAADYEAILPICERFGVPVVEDAAEALGASYRGKPCGGFGTIGIYSFNGNKIITTSGGGMLVSDDPDRVAHARKLATQARDDAPWYEHSELGYNYRMSNVLAGIGRGQLGVLDERVAARRGVFDQYREALADVAQIQWMPERDGSFSNRWLTTCTLTDGLDPQTICTDLARLDIEARRTWKPMHLQPLYAGARYFTAGGNADVAARLFDTGLCLPSGSNMTSAEVERVCEALSSAVARAAG